MMRIASVLLIAVMMSTCAISGTFAKYVTSDSATDTARVAKFGVVVDATSGMFKTEYNNVAGETFVGTTVSSSTLDNLVAPGTSGNMAEISITGTPEVAVRVTYEVTSIDLGDNWKDSNAEFYCPLKIKITNSLGTTTLCGLDYDSVEDFEKAIKDSIAAYSKEYAPKTDLSSKQSENLDVSWEWSFVDTTPYISGTQTDEEDTYLGNIAAGGTVILFDLAIKTTVTQID